MYDRPGFDEVHGHPSFDEVYELAVTAAGMVPAPARPRRRLSMLRLMLRAMLLHLSLLGIAVLSGANPAGASLVSLVATFAVLTTYVAMRRQAIAVAGPAVSRRRARALNYLDILDDDAVVRIVDEAKAAAALERQEAVDAAWHDYLAHAASPIASLDPASWEARRKELAKILTDLGERPDSMPAAIRRIARDGDEITPGPFETWAINRKRRKS